MREGAQPEADRLRATGRRPESGPRAIVLGAAAGGGFPQWNCRCGVCALAWDGDPRVRPRKQSSLAVSAGGEDWCLLNASPDLGQQIRATPSLQPRARRDSPIRAVVLTNGDVDHVAGLLTLREKAPLALFATAETRAAVAANPLFGVLDPALVEWNVVTPGRPFSPLPRLVVEAFAVPGKVPLYLESESVEIGTETGSTIGLLVTVGETRLAYVPGCAAVTPALARRLDGVDALLFDGTVFRDDEMIAAGVGAKSGRRMGHLPVGGPAGSLAALAEVAAGRKVFVHINNTNPMLVDGSPERRAVEAAGWSVAEDGTEIALPVSGAPGGISMAIAARYAEPADDAVAADLLGVDDERPLTPEDLEARLRAIGAARYHDRHPFHRLLHDGALDRGQVQAWALNRYAYQAAIPRKDAAIVSRMEDSALRRAWRQRIVDHDGERAGDGGIARWLVLTDALGLDRSYVASGAGLLPATRFAVEAYVTFCRERPLLEAIASSLTEMFAPGIIRTRVAGMLAGYGFVSRETLAYFDRRLTEAPRDADFALDYVKAHARTAEKQRAVIAALAFKCDVLWAQLDALHFAYVAPRLTPPGAFLPEGAR